MVKTDIGWIARVIGGFQNAIQNRPTRIRKSLIKTGDHLVALLYYPLRTQNKEKKLTGEDKRLYHYCRQWRATRKKLK